MNTMKIGKIDIKLPLVARSLCQDAIILADDLRGAVSDSEFNAYRLEFILGFMGMGHEILEKGLPELNFDLDHFSTYPEEKVLDGSIVGPYYSKYGRSKGFIDGVMEATNSEHNLHSAALLLFYIESIRTAEDRMLALKKFDYKSLMNSVSSNISAISQLIVIHNSMPAKAQVFSTNLKRKRGAKKGGAATSQRMAELKELVLLEASTLHQNSKSTDAAKAIYEKLKEKSVWLNDPNGKPLLKEPTTRFIAWIREDRKKLNQKVTCA